ncbi:MAG TPA: CAP domain-containing protein [Conexibacter sp.]|nr:CAP domain-containing protein [Conexibacter sp.]
MALTLTPAALAMPADAAEPAAGATPPIPATPVATPYRDALVRELNRVRARRALPSVRFDRRLSGGATAHSRDMVHKRYFAHGTWTTRVRASAAGADAVGEVLGWLVVDDPTEEATWLVRQWLRSPPHRAVLLERGFGRVGIGRVTNAEADGRVTATYTADFASVG